MTRNPGSSSPIKISTKGHIHSDGSVVHSSQACVEHEHNATMRSVLRFVVSAGVARHY